MLPLAFKSLLKTGLGGALSRHSSSKMNRPRNRQARPPRSNQRSTPRQPTTSTVPTIQQVVPGAGVSVVLKADQTTGREVQGTVKDLLTRGDHPRGIKVRLQDGHIGRVQRMVAGDLTSPAGMEATSEILRANMPVETRRTQRDEDDDSQELPPPRSLAVFKQAYDRESTSENFSENSNVFSSAVAKCPICGLFEGDEAAVSHHVQSHLD